MDALEDAFRAGVNDTLPVYVTESIKKALADMRGWLDRGVSPHTTAASDGLAAQEGVVSPDEAGEADCGGRTGHTSPWTFFYTYNPAHYIDLFLRAFENAAILPSGGILWTMGKGPTTQRARMRSRAHRTAGGGGSPRPVDDRGRTLGVRLSWPIAVQRCLVMRLSVYARRGVISRRPPAATLRPAPRAARRAPPL